MPCDITKTMKAQVPEKYKQTIDMVAKHFTNDQNKVAGFAMKIQDFYEVIKTVEGKDALKAMGEHEDITDTIDGWVKKHSYEKYDTFKGLLESGDKPIVELLNRTLNAEMKYVAAVFENPQKVKIDTTISNEFKNVFLFNAGVIKRGNIATSILSGDAGARLLMGDSASIPGEIIINRSNLFKQYRPAQRTYTEIESIQNSTDNYMAKTRKIIKNMINKHTDKVTTDKIITKYIGYLDGGYPDGKKTLLKLLEDREGLDLDKRTEVMVNLEAFQKDWNTFNYGTDTPKGMTNADVLNQKYETSVSYGDESIPTFLNFILNVGNRLKKLADSRTTELHPMEKKTSELFGPEGVFKIRSNNYVPSAKEDLLGGIINSPALSNLYGDVSFMKERKTILANPDGADFLDIVTNNIKSFKHFANKMAEYSGFRLIKDSMDDNPDFFKADPVAYRGINHLSETIIKDYESDPKVVPMGVQVFKKLTGAFAGLVASTILTNSAPANYAAGAITISSRIGFKHAGEIIKDYKGKLKSTDVEGDIARDVKNYFTTYSPYSKVSDIITKDLSMKEIGINKVVDGIANAAAQTSDFLVSKGILGLIPPLRWLAFNESENKLLSISEALAFESARTATNAAREVWSRKHAPVDGVAEPFDQKKFLKQYLDDNSEDIFTMTKEAVGDFSKYVKPIWSWKILRDADTYNAVLRGGIASLGYMFKQVEAVNMHVLNRLGGALKHSMKNEFASPASAGAALGVILLTLYDYLSKKESEIPKVGLLLGASPTGNALTAIEGLKGFVKVIGNMPVSEQEANDISGFWRLIGGVPFGASMRPDKDLVNGDMKKVIDNFSINMDMGYGFFKAVASGMFEKHDTQELYGFNDEMSNALAKNTILFGQSNDILTLIKDGAFVTNAIFSASTSNDKRTTSLLVKQAKNKVQSSVIKMLGGSVYFGPQHYKDLAYKNFDYENDSFLLNNWKKRSYTPYKRTEALAFAMERYMMIPKNFVYTSALRNFEMENKLNQYR